MFGRGVARLLAVVLFVVAPGLVVLPRSVAADPVVEDVVSFADVPESSLFYKEISWLASEGISTGWDVGGGVRQYRPLTSIARDAMAAFLYRKAGSPTYTPPGTSPFTDMSPGAAFYKEITWLASKGISTGWDVGGGKREYRPWKPIARDAMAAFLFRFAQPAQFTAPAQSPFVDVAAGGAFYREITWLASSGISTGWDIGGGARQYRPLNGIARDAMAAFLYRYASEKVPVDPLEPAAGTVTVAPEVQLLAPAELDAAQVSGSAVILPSQNAQDIHPNDVLVSGITPATPDGLLVRVVQVARDPAGTGTTTLKTQPATLPEAVVSTSGLLEVSGIPESSTFVPEADVTRTAATTKKLASPLFAAQADIFSQSFTWRRTQKAELGSSTLSGSGSVSVASSVTAAAKARMTLETAFLQLKETSVTITPSLTATHSKTFTGSLKGTISAPLGELWAKFRFMVGPVPVVVSAQLKVTANLSAEGEAEISYTSAQTVSSDHGFSYRDGSFSLINTKPTSTVTENTVRATESLTARTSLDFDATIKFYGVAGVTFGAGPYVSAAIAVVTSNGAKTWSCPIEFGHDTRVGVVAGIKILGLKAEWSDIATTTWKLANANPCEGTPVQAPESPGVLAIQTASLPQAAAGTAYHGQLAASGGKPPYHWSISSGSLPTGLSLTPVTGLISGTPTQAGTESFTAHVQDSAGAASSKALTLDITTSQAPGPTSITSVSASHSAAYGLRADGTVWAWGRNNMGQLGDGTTNDSALPVQVKELNNVTRIAAGNGGAAYAVKADGTVWSWGFNAYGQLGNDSTSNSLVPVRAIGLTDIASIIPGDNESVFAIQRDGTLWAWGANWGGQLGTGSYLNHSRPVSVMSGVRSITASSGVYSTYALMTDGTVWAWGVNSSGQLGNGTTQSSPVPVEVIGLTGVESVASAGGSAIAQKADGTVWTWGSNGWGELGNGSFGGEAALSPTPVTGLTEVRSITAKRSSSIYAVRNDGTVWAWGKNLQGELGDGTTIARPSPVQVTGLSNVLRVQASGYDSVFAHRADGTVFAWGWNGYGQLGNSTATDTSVPVAVRDITGVQELFVADGFGLALKMDRTLWSWGNNQYGQLGIGNTTNSSVPVRVQD